MTRRLIASPPWPPLYAEQVQIVTVDPSIKTVADLEGKNVSVGQAGSGVYFNAVDILSAYGIGDLDADGKFTKINATYQSFRRQR